MNRGIARRTVFETRADARQFLAGVAREVRAGRLEVHAFALMTTHFHMLVRSPDGLLAEAMRRIQNAYVRRFNRTRQRDGALFRGRFASRVIEDIDDRDAVVSYIDRNPVEARLAQAPELHPWCSAWYFASARLPRWLDRGWVESRVQHRHGGSPWSYAAYAALFHGRTSAAVAEWVNRRQTDPAARRRAQRSMLAEAPAPVLAWMQRKAQVADGTAPGTAIADPHRIRDAVQAARSAHGPWRRRSQGRNCDRWRDAEIVLLCQLCRSTIGEAAQRCGVSRSTAYSVVAQHPRSLRSDAEYARRFLELVGTVSDTV